MKLLNGRHRRLAPIVLQTERPDRIGTMLERGKAAMLIDGSRFGFILPVRLFDFMHAMDDDYEFHWMSKLLIAMRYLAMFLTIVLPASYVAIVSYNPEVLRVQLTLSIAGSRVVVPYPSFIEVFLMLFMIEALIEASLRLPRSIGSTATSSPNSKRSRRCSSSSGSTKRSRRSHETNRCCSAGACGYGAHRRLRVQRPRQAVFRHGDGGASKRSGSIRASRRFASTAIRTSWNGFHCWTSRKNA